MPPGTLRLQPGTWTEIAMVTLVRLLEKPIIIGKKVQFFDRVDHTGTFLRKYYQFILKLFEFFAVIRSFITDAMDLGKNRGVVT